MSQNLDIGTKRIVRLLFRDNRWMLIYWAILVFTAACIYVGNFMFGEVNASIWEKVSWHPRILMFIGAIFVPGVHLSMYVAHGISRRRFIAGGSVFIVANAALASLVVVAVYGIEYATFALSGVPWKLQNPHLYSAAGVPVSHFVETFLILSAYACSGLLIGAGYSRLGWLSGTLFLPVAVAPALGVEFLSASGWAGELVKYLEIVPLSPLLAFGASVVIIALSILATFRLVRTVAIGRKVGWNSK